MHIRSVLLVLLILSSCISKKTDYDGLLFENVSVIDVMTGEVQVLNVLAEKGLITRLSPTKLSAPTGTRVIAAKGKYLIPGLWDMHVHLSMMGETGLPLFVANGITGVRDMGGDFTELTYWRDSLSNELIPLIRTPGPILESPRFYAILKTLLGPSFTKTRIPVGSVARAGQVVDSLKQLGVDFIKIRTVESQAIFNAIASAAVQQGLPFTGHIDQNLSILESVGKDIASIEHSGFLQALNMDEAERQKTMAQIKLKKPSFVPTLIAMEYARLTPTDQLTNMVFDSLENTFEKRKYISNVLLENWAIELELSKLEAPLDWPQLNRTFLSFSKEIAKNTDLVAGTDTGVKGIVPGWSLHEELALMVEQLDINNLQALQSATINAATLLNLEGSHGTIAEGKFANMVLLNSNPLEDIKNTSSIHMVVKDGKLLDRPTLDSLLEAVVENVEQERSSLKWKRLGNLKEQLKKLLGR